MSGMSEQKCMFPSFLQTLPSMRPPCSRLWTQISGFPRPLLTPMTLPGPPPLAPQPQGRCPAPPALPAAPRRPGSRLVATGRRPRPFFCTSPRGPLGPVHPRSPLRVSFAISSHNILTSAFQARFPLALCALLPGRALSWTLRASRSRASRAAPAAGGRVQSPTFLLWRRGLLPAGLPCQLAFLTAVFPPPAALRRTAPSA